MEGRYKGIVQATATRPPSPDRITEGIQRLASVIETEIQSRDDFGPRPTSGNHHTNELAESYTNLTAQSYPPTDCPPRGLAAAAGEVRVLRPDTRPAA